MRLCLLIILCLYVGNAIASNVDSLKRALHQAAETKQIPILLDLAWDEDVSLHERKGYAIRALKLTEKNNNKPDQLDALKVLSLISQRSNENADAEKYFRETALLAKTVKDLQALSTAYNNLGIFFQQLGEYDSALLYYQLAVDLFGELGLHLNKAQNQVNSGIIYKNIGLYHDAIESSLAAVAVLEKEHDTASLVSAYNNIGNSLKELKEYKNAEYYLSKALSYKNSSLPKKTKASILNNLGNVYRDWGKIDKALSAYTESLQIKEQIGDSVLIASTLDNLAEAHFLLHNYSLAEVLFKKALNLRSVKNYTPGMTTSLNRLSKFAIEHISIDSAEYFAKQALELAIKSKIRDEELESYRLLKQINEKKENYKLALHYADRYSELYDSLFEENKIKAIANIEIKYRTKQYINDLELSKEREKAQLDKIKNRELINVLLLALSFVFLLGLGLIYRNFRNMRKAKLVESNLRKSESRLKEEIIHRTGNNLAVIKKFINVSAHKISSSDDKLEIQNMLARVEAVSDINTLLNENLETDSKSFSDYANAILKNAEKIYKNADQTITTRVIGNINLSTDDTTVLGLILNELVTNCYEHAFAGLDNGSILVELSQNENSFHLSVTDNGNGIPELTHDLVKTYGMNIVFGLAEQIKATVTIINNNGAHIEIIKRY